MLYVTQNTLLNSLQKNDLRAIFDIGSWVNCAKMDILQRANEPVTAAYFPDSGWVSMLATLDGGCTTEVGVIGREGMVGLEILLDNQCSSFGWIVPRSSRLLRVDTADLKNLLRSSNTFKASLAESIARVFDHVARMAACNVGHSVDQRLARWLLLAHDRSQDQGLVVTRDLLATMLGVRRTAISYAVNQLRLSNCINYADDVVTIRNRAALRAAACGCYAANLQPSE